MSNNNADSTPYTRMVDLGIYEKAGKYYRISVTKAIADECEKKGYCAPIYIPELTTPQKLAEHILECHPNSFFRGLGQQTVEQIPTPRKAFKVEPKQGRDYVSLSKYLGVKDRTDDDALREKFASNSEILKPFTASNLKSLGSEEQYELIGTKPQGADECYDTLSKTRFFVVEVGKVETAVNSLLKMEGLRTVVLNANFESGRYRILKRKKTQEDRIREDFKRPVEPISFPLDEDEKYEPKGTINPPPPAGCFGTTINGKIY